MYWRRRRRKRPKEVALVAALPNAGLVMAHPDPTGAKPASGLLRELAGTLRDRSSLGNQLLGAIIGSAGLRLLGVVFGFLIGVQLARYLGPQQYGIYGYAMAVCAIASTIAAFGIPLLATREAAIACTRRDWPALIGIVRWSFLIVSILSLAAATATSAVILWSGHSVDDDVAFWAGAMVPLLCILMLCGALLRGMGTIVGGQSLDTVVGPGLQVALLLAAYLAWGQIGAASALALTVLAGAITSALALLWLWQAVPENARKQMPRFENRNWMQATLPLGMTTILNVFDAMLPLLIMGTMSVASDVGVFRVALSSIIVASFPHTLLSIVTPPIAARTHAEGDRRRMQILASVSAIGICLSTLAISVVLYAWGEQLLVLLFGADYAGAWLPLMILCAASVVGSTVGISIAVLHASGNEREVTWAIGASLTTGILTLPLLVPQYGGVGAASAVLASAIVKASILYLKCRQKADIDCGVFMAPVKLALNRNGAA